MSIYHFGLMDQNVYTLGEKKKKFEFKCRVWTGSESNNESHFRIWIAPALAVRLVTLA